MLQRAHDLADRLGGDARIKRRGIELGVTEQGLDHADVDVLLEYGWQSCAAACAGRPAS